jgi:hypothetical protein
VFGANYILAHALRLLLGNGEHAAGALREASHVVFCH